ncbi:hypothetical protein [Ancylobacter lacus]|uniref:hypothetical protein n=1 Tax=Ancylobacter lacus TaxID=2579970 RepID=UPI001BCFD850|nr:hypothetical protein [Ancylobacter lacus]MBS7540512.1 hypothetical protein [Ancylobacter lacus]
MSISLLITCLSVIAAAVAGWRADSFAGALGWNAAISLTVAFALLFFFGDMSHFVQGLISGAASFFVALLLPVALGYMLGREHRRYRSSNQA